jgi:probable rRNA maturation factor
MPIAIDLIDATKRLRPDQLAFIDSHLRRAIELLGASGDVRIRIVDDPEMAQNHQDFCGVEGTTDVITFDLSDPDANPEAKPAIDLGPNNLVNVRNKIVLDTDILICLDEADRQSHLRNHPIQHELLLYTLHGILHCLGFEDHEEADHRLMHAVEDAVLAQIGVGPLFASRKSDYK